MYRGHGGVGKHGKDGRSASDVEDDLVLEQVGVLVDGIAVRLGPDFVFLFAARRVSRAPVGKSGGHGGSTHQHFFVDAFKAH